MAMTLDQQKAVAMASARMRAAVAEGQPEDFASQQKAEPGLVQRNNETTIDTLAAIGKGVGDVGLGAQKLLGKFAGGIGADTVGNWLVNDAEQGREKLRRELAPYKARSPRATGISEVGGNVLATLPVGGVLAKAPQALAKLPMLASQAPRLNAAAMALRTGGFRTGLPAATTFGGKAAQMAGRSAAGAAVGGVSAGLVNEDSAGMGAGMGAVLPPAMRFAGGVGRSAKASLYDPFFNQRDVIGNVLAREVGVDGLLSREIPRTAGVSFSLGQQTGNQGIAAIEDTLRAINPGGALSSQAARNRQVLADSMRGMAQDEGAVAAAVQSRKAATAPLYQAASKATSNVEPSRTVNLIDRIVAKHPANSALVSPLEQIRDSLYRSPGQLRQKPHEVMSAIDNIKAMIGKQENAFVRSELNTIKKSLEHQLGKAAPEFRQAERVFAEQSIPINRMQINQLLANKLIPPTAGDVPTGLNAASLATALRNPDQVARAATGFKRARFDKTLGPDSSAVRGISSDASRIAEMNRLGAGFGSPTKRRETLEHLIANNLANEAPILNRLTNALTNTPFVGLPVRAGRAAAGAIASSANKGMIEQLETMLASNPDEVVELLKSAAARQAVKAAIGDDKTYAPMLRALLFTAPASQANQETRQ